MSATELTPLEELQAAHKRLSELRHGATPGPWTSVDDDDFEEIDIQGESPFNVGSVWTGHSADLIVTLYRTIDAQLGILTRAVHSGRPYANGASTVAPPTWLPGFIGRDALDLARAINGSDHA